LGRVSAAVAFCYEVGQSSDLKVFRDAALAVAAQEREAAAANEAEAEKQAAIWLQMDSINAAISGIERRLDAYAQRQRGERILPIVEEASERGEDPNAALRRAGYLN
jgi:hypothetical protein